MWFDDEPFVPQNGIYDQQWRNQPDVDIDKALYGDGPLADMARAAAGAAWKPEFPELWELLGDATGVGDHGTSAGDMLGR